MKNNTGKTLPKSLSVKVDFIEGFYDGDNVKYEIQLKRPYSFDSGIWDISTFRISESWSDVVKMLKSAVKNEEGWKNKI